MSVWGMRREIKMAPLDSLAVAITTCFVCICALQCGSTIKQDLNPFLIAYYKSYRSIYLEPRRLRTVIYSVAIVSYGKVFTGKASAYLLQYVTGKS